MPHVAEVIVLGAGLALLAGWLWRRWRIKQQDARRRLAIMQFDEHRSDLQEEFLAAAAATGKPRGLRWKRCELGDACLFALDRTSGELFALVGATISFEAVAGGDMEEVEAVGNLRAATAIFEHRQGKWMTEGRVVFNLEPEQTLERFQESLTPFPESNNGRSLHGANA